jgi:Putative, 10TM heavy-metal exporter
VIDVAKHTLMITGFVAVMMLVIEYVNVLTSGAWQSRLAGHRWGQLLLAAALGAIPGCLGAFAVVALYSHRVLTLGAVVAAMVATSGDEAFVMLALIPEQALIVAVALLGIGIAAGALTDAIVGWRTTRQPERCEGFEFHPEDHCRCFPRGQIVNQWRNCIPARGILAVVLSGLVIALMVGELGPTAWNWMRVTLVLVSLTALFIVGTVPDHFLEEHLWRHVALKHVPRVFLWTLGALIVLHVLTDDLHLDMASAVQQSQWLVLLLACMVGLIPESGPHLIFVTLYAQGALPLSILLASSAVQDGHGMLPMLAHSRRAFLVIKAINFAIGLLVGSLMLAMGL